MYTYQLDLAAVLRLASVSRAWVKPMHQIAQVLSTFLSFRISAICCTLHLSGISRLLRTGNAETLKLFVSIISFYLDFKEESYEHRSIFIFLLG